MKFFGMKKPTDKTVAEVKLDQIRDILFPPCERHTDKQGVKYQVDFSVDMNLDAALTDLEEGYNDPTSRETIKKVANRLYQVREILDAYQELTDADYLIVDDLSEDIDEKIQASDREH